MRASPLAFLKNCALLICLLTPSVWMTATIPPLWRDSDAYNQVTQHPLMATFWGHGPAYCYASRVPLLLGKQFERWQGTAAATRQEGESHLTDTGVWLLIATQHVALCGAAFYFILTISRLFLVRLGLALVWASNALFYTFAHCVGSETLGMILVIVLVTLGLRLMRSRSESRWTVWSLFAITLCFCVLSRHVNLWLLSLLPVAALLSWAQNRIATRFVAGDRKRRWRQRLGAMDLQRAAISIAVAIACFAAANYLVRGLARKTQLQPESRIGFTFLWRLHFLKTLAPEARAALLRKVSDRSPSTRTRQLIELLGQMYEEGADLRGPGLFFERAIPLLFLSEKETPWANMHHELNQMAFAFLLPPTPEHWRAAGTEFAATLRMPVTEIPFCLFLTTVYYFEHKSAMPACAELVTFRNGSTEQIMQIPIQRLYFRLWRGLNYRIALLIWIVSLLALITVARWKRVNVSASTAFGIAVTSVGLLMVGSTCLLGEFTPRYGLPMWELLLLSLSIFVGKTAELLATRRLQGPLAAAVLDLEDENPKDKQKLDRPPPDRAES